MKVSDYVPKIYQDNIEMINLINTEEVEFEKNIKVQLLNAFNDNFPAKATENGIDNFEKLLQIQQDTNNTDLEYRRAKVITVLTTTFPLSFNWLISSLNNYVGIGNYEILLDVNNYELVIKCSNVFNDMITILYNYYRPLIPANLIFRIAVAEEINSKIYIAGMLHQGDKINIERKEG